MTPRRADVLCVLGLVAAAVMLACYFIGSERALFPFHTGVVEPWKKTAEEWVKDEPVNFNVGDKHTIIHPDLTFTLSEIESGHLPLWNPNHFAGLPHQANPLTATAYPLNALFSYMEPMRGYGVSAALHLLCAALFTFMFLRAIDVGPGASLIGGIGFALGGWMTVHLQHNYFVHTMVWLPLGLFSIERLLRHGSRWALMTLAVSIGLMLLAGFIQTAVINCYVLAIYAAVGLVCLARKRGPAATSRKAVLLLCFALLGVAIGAVQLLPAFELAGTAGHRDIPIERLKEDALKPVSLLGLLAPDFFGHPQIQKAPGENFFELWWLGARPNMHFTNNYSERTIAPGAFLLLFALAALFVRRDRPTLVVAALAVGGLFAAVGSPLLDLLAALPGLDFGSPMRFAQIAAFGLPVLGAIGFDVLLKAGRRERPRLFRFVVILGTTITIPMLALLFAMWLAPGWSAARFTDWLVERGIDTELGFGAVPTPMKYAGMKTNVLYERQVLSRAFALLLLSISVIALWARGHLGPRAVLLFAVLLVGGELSWRSWRFNQPVRFEGMYQETPGIRHLQRRLGTARFMRFGRGTEQIFFSPNAPLTHGLRDAQGFRALTPQSYLEFMRTVEANPFDVGLLNIQDVASLQRPQMGLLRVKFAISAAPIDGSPWTPVHPEPGATGTDFYIYRNDAILPRAFMVRDVEVLSSDRMLERFKNLAPAAGDEAKNPFRERVWLNTLPDGLKSRYDIVPGDGGVVVIEDAPGRVQLAVDGAADRMVVLSEQYATGWSATAVSADGERSELDIERANHTFMAVEVPQGTKRVEFFYDPSSFKWGGLLSGVAVVMLLLVPLFPALGRRGACLSEPVEGSA